jgi:hypothetical protein
LITRTKGIMDKDIDYGIASDIPSYVFDVMEE